MYFHNEASRPFRIGLKDKLTFIDRVEIVFRGRLFEF